MPPRNTGHPAWLKGRAVIPVAGWDAGHSTPISKPDVSITKIRLIFSKNCQAAENPFPELCFEGGGTADHAHCIRCTGFLHCNTGSVLKISCSQTQKCRFVSVSFQGLDSKCKTLSLVFLSHEIMSSAWEILCFHYP